MLSVVVSVHGCVGIVQAAVVSVRNIELGSSPIEGSVTEKDVK